MEVRGQSIGNGRLELKCAPREVQMTQSADDTPGRAGQARHKVQPD